MGVSVFTFLMSLLWCNVFILLGVLCRRTLALKHGVNLILAMIAAGIVRLLVPIELPTVIVVRSEEIMPFFQRFFSAQAFEMHEHSVNWLDIILAIWIVGSVIHLLLIAWTLFQQSLKIRRMRTEDHPRVSKLAEELGRDFKMTSKCRVVVSPDVKTPMLVGYFSPIILLPPLALTDDDMRYVLLHEWNHFIHRHLWIKLLFSTFCALLWWNPLVYMAESDLDYLLEVSCDRASVRSLNAEERIKYVEATSNVMKQLVTLVTRSTLFVGFITAAPDRIVQRCELILFPPKKISKTIKILTIASLIILIILSYAFVFQTLYRPPEDDSPKVTDVSIVPEHSYLKEKADGSFLLYINGEPRDSLSREDINYPPFSDLPIHK